MTPEQAAAAGKRAILKLGGAFSHDPRTMRKARQLGLTGWAFYVAGRGGALGDVRADTVAGVLGFIAPEAVRDGWERPQQSSATGDRLEPWTATTGCGTSRAVRHWDRAGARDQKPAAGSPQAAADGANVRRRASSGEAERPGGGRYLTATLDA